MYRRIAQNVINVLIYMQKYPALFVRVEEKNRILEKTKHGAGSQEDDGFRTPNFLMINVTILKKTSKLLK